RFDETTGRFEHEKDGTERTKRNNNSASPDTPTNDDNFANPISNDRKLKGLMTKGVKEVKGSKFLGFNTTDVDGKVETTPVWVNLSWLEMEVARHIYDNYYKAGRDDNNPAPLLFATEEYSTRLAKMALRIARKGNGDN